MVTSADLLKAGILIVDDQEVNVSLLEQMLRGAGYVSITSTMDPGEVCELHRRNGYDLILLDLRMPVMDGFQVMEGLQEIDPDDYVPVLVITAEPGHKLRALQAGARDFISKPFDLAEVLARVHNMLEVRLLHAETKSYSKALETQNDELQKALEKVKLLSGLLPICAWCKKIRDDQGYWNAIEHYLSEHSEAEFTHGICPDCRRKYSGELLHEEK
jgi:adenylate cyclase